MTARLSGHLAEEAGKDVGTDTGGAMWDSEGPQHPGEGRSLRRGCPGRAERTLFKSRAEPSFALTSESMNWPGRGPGAGTQVRGPHPSDLWDSGCAVLSQPLPVPDAWTRPHCQGRRYLDGAAGLPWPPPPALSLLQLPVMDIATLSAKMGCWPLTSSQHQPCNHRKSSAVPAPAGLAGWAGPVPGMVPVLPVEAL